MSSFFREWAHSLENEGVLWGEPRPQGGRRSKKYGTKIIKIWGEYNKIATKIHQKTAKCNKMLQNASFWCSFSREWAHSLENEHQNDAFCNILLHFAVFWCIFVAILLYSPHIFIIFVPYFLLRLPPCGRGSPHNTPSFSREWAHSLKNELIL